MEIIFAIDVNRKDSTKVLVLRRELSIYEIPTLQSFRSASLTQK